MTTTLSRRRLYRARIKKSLCQKKTSKKCKKVRGCKTAKGPKRSFCRKIHNIKNTTRKNKKSGGKFCHCYINKYGNTIYPHKNCTGCLLLSN